MLGLTLSLGSFYQQAHAFEIQKPEQTTQKIEKTQKTTSPKTTKKSEPLKKNGCLKNQKTGRRHQCLNTWSQ